MIIIIIIIERETELTGVAELLHPADSWSWKEWIPWSAILKDFRRVFASSAAGNTVAHFGKAPDVLNLGYDRRTRFYHADRNSKRK